MGGGGNCGHQKKQGASIAAKWRFEFIDIIGLNEGSFSSSGGVYDCAELEQQALCQLVGVKLHWRPVVLQRLVLAVDQVSDYATARTKRGHVTRRQSALQSSSFASTPTRRPLSSVAIPRAIRGVLKTAAADPA